MPLKFFRLVVNLPDNIVGLRVKAPGSQHNILVPIMSWSGNDLVVKSNVRGLFVEYAVRDGNIIHWRAITPIKIEEIYK